MTMMALLSYLTVGAAARILGVDPSTVSRWVSEGRLGGHLPQTAPGERPRVLLWGPDVRKLKAARDLVAGREPDPCAAGCPDPEMHAEGGHDV